MPFFKDFFTRLGSPGYLYVIWTPKGGQRPEDVGEQALIRRLDTA